MDSMRQLSTSLPRSRQSDNREDLMSSFKAAALSVTNLYKTAISDQAKSRAAGYQDAVDDLLQFLEKEGLGMGTDGEGWRIRQWATERSDGEMSGRMASDEEDEAAPQEDADARSSSPEVQRKASVPVQQASEPAETSTPSRRSPVPPPNVPQPQVETSVTSARHEQPTVPHLDDFLFRSQHAYPSSHDRQQDQHSNMDLDSSSVASTPSSTETVRILPSSRHHPKRDSHNSNHNSRNNNRRDRENNRTTINLNLGAAGAGSKRKIPFPDFFNISEPADGQDNRNGKDGGNPRGGKRGRHV